MVGENFRDGVNAGRHRHLLVALSSDAVAHSGGYGGYVLRFRHEPLCFPDQYSGLITTVRRTKS